MTAKLILAFAGVVLALSLVNTFLQLRLLSTSFQSTEQKRLKEEKKRLDTFLSRKKKELLDKALSCAEDAELRKLVTLGDENGLRRKLELLRKALLLDVLGVVYPEKGKLIFQMAKNVSPVDTPSDVRFSKAKKGEKDFFTMKTNLGLEMRQVVPVGSPPQAALLAGLSLQQNFVKEQKKLFGMDAAVLYEANVLAHTFPFEFRFFPASILFSMKKARGKEAQVFQTVLGQQKEPYYAVVKPIYKEDRGNREGFIALLMSRRESMLAAKEAFRRMVLLAAISFLLALVISIVVGRGMVRPIVHLARQADLIARGKSKEIQVAMREDEIGELNKAFYTMTSSLQDVILQQNMKIEEILKFVERAGQGDLTGKLDEKGESAFASLSRGLNRMMESLIHILRNLFSAAEDLKSSANQLLSLSTQQSHTMRAQQQQAAEVVSSTEENAASLRKLSEVAHALADLSQKMKALSQKGEASLYTVKQAMQQIRDQAQKTHRQMESLDNLAMSIGDFVVRIEDIAHKIHLLSLNAAIEAARAGEAGRGFSVVAQEIRSLSSSTGRLAVQIKELIEKIQEASAATKKVSQEEVALIGRGEGDIGNMADVLQDILEGIKTCDDLSSQIHLATQEGKQGAERVTVNMREMEGSLREAKEAAESLRAQAEELNTLAEKLHAVASGFQLP